MHDPMQSAPAGNRGASRNVRAGHDKSTPTLDLFGSTAPDDVRQRRDAGMARALHSEDVRIASAYEAAVRRYAASEVEFTPCEVLPQVASRKSFGAIIRRLTVEGVIVCVGARNSTAPSRNGSLTRVYRGTGGGAR